MTAFAPTFGVSAAGDARHLSEFAQEAEALGFERVTMGEHVMDGNPPRPTDLALPLAAAAAGATRQLRVMTGIVIAPLYHPVLLAKLVTTVDLVWGVMQPTAIADDRQDALALAVTNVGQRYLTPGRSAEDIAQALYLTGTPDDCIRGIEARIEAGVRDFVFGFLADDEEARLAQVELFAKRVIPYFKKP